MFAETNGLVFPYTPSIAMQKSITYDTTELLHTNLAVRQLKNATPPKITISSDWTADTEENALQMYGAIHFCRALSLVNFGKNAGTNKGMPPPILYLNGWGELFTNIPVVITDYNPKLSNNIHYVHLNKTIDGIKIDTWLPTTMDLSITLEIQPNINTYKNEFKLDEFKKNILMDKTKSGNGYGYTW